jgi:hypothetical protein
MANSFRLTKKRIQAGVYEGLLTGSAKGAPDPQVEMIHLGHVVGEVQTVPVTGTDGQWLVQARIPAEYLTDGVQTFLLVFVDQADILDRFSVITGEPLEDDLRAEIALLRAELDMLKKAFRRHCVETLG